MSIQKKTEQLYKALVPECIRDFIPSKRTLNNRRWKQLRKETLDYYDGKELNTEQTEAVDFLRSNDLSFILSTHLQNISPNSIEVFEDESLNLKYVQQGGKKLYFKKDVSVAEVKEMYAGLLREQLPDSPHCYLTTDFQVNENDVVIDAGAAEGNFSLSVIEKVKKIYIFEPDPLWIEALHATFAPWKEKVVIIEKLISDKTDGNFIALDDAISDKKVDFLKADIEGFETSMLHGMPQILTVNKLLKMALCVYHNQNDEEKIAGFLKANNFSYQTSKGLVVFLYDKNQQPPYFRHCLLRAQR